MECDGLNEIAFYKLKSLNTWFQLVELFWEGLGVWFVKGLLQGALRFQKPTPGPVSLSFCPVCGSDNKLSATTFTTMSACPLPCSPP